MITAKCSSSHTQPIYTRIVNILNSLSNITLLVLIVIAIFIVPQMVPNAPNQDSVTATAAARAASIHQQYPHWTPVQCQRIANGIVIQGMTAEMVQLAWGSPAETRIDKDALRLVYNGFLAEAGKLVRSPANMKGLIVEVELQEDTVVGIQELRESLAN